MVGKPDRNICGAYGLEVPNSYGRPPKGVENNRAKFQWDSEFQTNLMKKGMIHLG